MIENTYSSPSFVYKQQRFVRSPIAQTLVDRLRQLQPNELVTYKELADLCHEDVQNRHFLRDAREICLNKHDIVLVAEIGVGIRRIPDEQVPQFSNDRHYEIKRKAPDL